MNLSEGAVMGLLFYRLTGPSIEWAINKPDYGFDPRKIAMCRENNRGYTG